MSGLFPHREHTDPWFRIGRLEVNTTMFVVLAVVVAILPWVITGPNWTATTYYNPGLLTRAEVWRLFTWPFAEGLSNTLWSVINLFMLWYFGTSLESQIGRKPMAGLFVAIWAILTASYSVAAILFIGSSTVLYGIGMVQFLLLLVWIAEYPHARFLFNIPAWVFGAVILGVQLLVMIAYGQYASLVALLLSLAFVAIAARRAGLLREYSWIPGQPRSPRRPKTKRRPRSEVKAAERRASDQERMDALLDQINEKGLHSLSPAQRKELKTLSDRRRQG
jgi:signal transduction histidine kinase